MIIQLIVSDIKNKSNYADSNFLSVSAYKLIGTILTVLMDEIPTSIHSCSISCACTASMIMIH